MKPLNITFRLGAVFGLLLAILSVVGWQGVSHLRRLDAKMQNIVYDRWTEQQLAHQAFQLSAQNSQITLLIFLMDDQSAIQPLLAQRAANTQRISELVGVLEPRLDTEKERKLFAAVKAARAPYVESYQRALSLLLTEQKRDEAAKMMVSEVRPKLLTYQNAWGDFNQYEADEINVAMQQSKSEFADGQWNLLSLLGIAGLMAAGIGAFAIRILKREMAVRQRAEKYLQQSRALEVRLVERTLQLARTNETLVETSALLETLLQTTADHIYFKDLQSRFIRFSLEMLKHFRLAHSDGLAGKTDFDFFTEEHARPAFEAEQEIIRTGQPMLNVEEKVTHVDGRVEWVLTSKMPWRDPAGTIIGTMGISRNITERKRSAEALEELSQKTELRERMLTTTLSALNDFAYIFDREGRFLFANQPLLNLWGITLEAAVGKNFSDLGYPEELARKLQSQVQQVFETGRNVTDETPYTSPTGVAGRYEYIFSPAAGADGTVEFVVGCTRDITARQQAEESLKRSEERFSSAFEFAPIGIALVAPDGRWVKVNRAICAIVGYSESELLARTFQEITHPDDLAADLEYVRRLLAGEIRFYEMEKRYIHARGHIVSILLDVSLVRDGRNQPLYFIAQIQDITERKRAEAALQESKRFLRSTLDALATHIAILDEHGTIIEANAAWNRFAGDNNYIGRNYLKVCDTASGNFSKEAPEVADGIRAVIAGQREEFQLEYPCHSPQEKRWFIVRATRFGGDGPVRVVVAHENITERKKLETQLFQSQKLETVGRLAGGFAHEFNSILTAILGQSELLLDDLPDGNPLAKNAAEINRAANRAAKLTHQLLAYGRKQLLQPESLDLNRVVSEMETMFHNLTGADVDVKTIPAVDLQAVKVDAGQMEQVIMNMVINARDAMPSGGKLTLETANVSFGAESVGRYPELKPGDYVMLAISDNGTGMSEAVKARVFEPFFTTKDVGQGTGLGLAACHGIVNQSGGHIALYSEPGRGTTFKIYLPQAGQKTETKISAPPKKPLELLRGTENILLVEDDPALRAMAATLLERLGYTVLTAGNGVEALNRLQERGAGHIDLLFTDVVMPHMSGRELADRVRTLHPQTKILFTSAYTENAIVHQGVLDKGVALLQKPFTPAALAKKIREVLRQAGAPKPNAAPKAFGARAAQNTENTL